MTTNPDARNPVRRLLSLAPAFALCLAGTLAATLAAAAPLVAQGTTRSASHARRLRVIVTGDLHGSLSPYVDARGYRSGGLAGTAAAVEQARRECVAPTCISLLVDAGDMLSGTPESDLTHGREAADAFAAMQYDALAPGNREFDWGIDTLAARVRGARLPLLGANVTRVNGAPLPWLPGDKIVRRGGLAVGIIGIASQLTAQTTNPDYVAALRFDDPAATVDVRAKSLRARGAQIVIVLSHAGVRCEGNLYGVATGAPSERCEGEALGAIARLTRPVDLWVGGHTHQKAAIWLDSTFFISSAANGRSISIVDVPVDEAGEAMKADVVANAREVDERMDARHVPVVDSIVAVASARAEVYLAQPVATLAVPLERTGAQYPLGNLITDAQRWAGKGDFAVTNNSGIHAGLGGGIATYKSIYDVQPFGNTLYKLTIQGAAVRAYLEAIVGADALIRHVSGATVVYDPARPSGSRITEVRLADGRLLADSATYTIVMNDYVRTMMIERTLGESVLDMTSLPINDRDAFIAYLKQLPQPVRAPREVRMRAAAGAAVSPNR